MKFGLHKALSKCGKGQDALMGHLGAWSGINISYPSLLSTAPLGNRYSLLLLSQNTALEYVWASVYVFLRGHRPSTFADDNPIKHLLAAPWPPPAPDCTAERETTFGAALPVSPVTLPWASTRFVLLSSVQSFSHVWLCYPLDSSHPSLPVHHQLSEFTQTHVHWVGDAIQPSHPLSTPSPPAFNLSQHQGLFQWVSSSHQVAKVLEFQLQHQSFQWIYRTDFL